MRRAVVIWLLVLGGVSLCADSRVPLEAVIADVYEQLTEVGSVDYEDLYADLEDIAAHPININTAQASDLERLHFLSDHQIDAILLYVYAHPMAELSELQLLDCLQDYEIRNLRAFVVAGPAEGEEGRIYPRDVFRYARHEWTARADVRHIEGYTTDPVFFQTRYKFNFRNRVEFGATLRRPAGGMAVDLGYGAYIQLTDIGPMRTIVAGNFQASFGQGLVLSEAFRSGKSAYVMTVGNRQDRLRKYTGTDGAGLHGIGATAQWRWGKQTRLDVSALYSLQNTQDSIWQHLLGANITLRHRRLQVGFTAVEKLYSDSVRPYRDMKYNLHYFRGLRQSVMGLNFRYSHGLFDLFGEVATAQNRRWGVGVVAGSRIYPTEGVGLTLLYRYYSPWFDNPQGYAFSETSRVNDEHGLYIGTELTRLRHWRWTLYGDFFYFSGIKYGIPYAPSWGYDAAFETQYLSDNQWDMSLRLRAQEKGRQGKYSLRARWDWCDGRWTLRTQADANLVCDSIGQTTYGVSLLQDIEYRFSRAPLTLRLRLQGFDARAWNSRIYCYEHDVLYGNAYAFVYGYGGRAYLYLKWQIIRQLSLYFRVSETLYGPEHAGDALRTRTDIHLLLRAAL